MLAVAFAIPVHEVRRFVPALVANDPQERHDCLPALLRTGRGRGLPRRRLGRRTARGGLGGLRGLSTRGRRGSSAASGTRDRTRRRLGGGPGPLFYRRGGPRGWVCIRR